MNVRLGVDQVPDLLAGKQSAQLLFVTALNHKIPVTDRYILHAKPFSYLRKDALAIHGKSEAVGIDVRGAHPRICDRGFAGGDDKKIQCDCPLVMGGFNFIAFPNAAGNIVGAGLVTELPPDFLPARTEQLSKYAHKLSPLE